MKLITPRSVKLFILLAFIMTVSAGLVYVAVQQVLRMNANDPQVQIAEDFSAQLATGAPVSPINPNLSVDFSKSLSPFVFLYDDTGKFVTGSGTINGQSPALPAGVLDYVRKVGEDRITWQPQAGTRVALVLIHYAGPQPGFVAVGRSLREVEQRESMLGVQVLSAWLAGIIGLIILMFAGEILLSRYFPQ